MLRKAPSKSCMGIARIIKLHLPELPLSFILLYFCFKGILILANSSLENFTGTEFFIMEMVADMKENSLTGYEKVNWAKSTDLGWDSYVMWLYLNVVAQQAQILGFTHIGKPSRIGTDHL